MGGLTACGSSAETGPTPKAAVSSSAAAQADFRRVEQAWQGLSPETAGSLEKLLHAFLRDHPTDGHADAARAYLAWLYLERRDIEPARKTLAPALNRPAGVVLDFAHVVDAAILLEEGEPERAYVELIALHGKLIDQQERALFLGTLVHAAHALQRHVEACVLMYEWLTQAPPNLAEPAILSIGVLLHETPSEPLEQALVKVDITDPSEPRANKQARRFLVDRFLRELRRDALERQDVNLAKRLLDAEIRRGRPGDEQLRALARGKPVGARVEGRTIGFALELAEATSRRRSSEVAAGISTTLSLATTEDSAAALRFRVREVEGEAVGAALADLVANGAVILIAGATAASASQASAWAEERHVPVLLLHQPDHSSEKRRRFSFGLGAPTDVDKTLLEAYFTAHHIAPLITVDSRSPGCDPTAAAPGASRFPTLAWKEANAGVLLLLTDTACGGALLRESEEHGLNVPLGLGLEAAPLVTRSQAKWVLQAGYFPFAGDQLPADLETFRGARGRIPTWHESLGHDAALMVQAALARLPVSTADDAQRVSQLQDLARLSLSQGQVSGLWTTHTPRFSPTLDLEREFVVAELNKL